jgi:hypothetical protein
LSERLDLIGFTANKDANMSDDPSVNPPAGDISSDKEDRMRDFFKRHGGPRHSRPRRATFSYQKDVNVYAYHGLRRIAPADLPPSSARFRAIR